MNKERERSEQGHQAKELLDNTLLQQWFFSANLSLEKQIRQAALANKFKLVEELNARRASLKAMRSDLKRYVRNGERAVSELGEKKPLDKIKQRLAPL